MFEDKKYQETYNYSIKIKDKIAKMRRTGLSKEGIYSPENLAFKMLRNSKYLEKLNFLKIESYNKMMSLTSEQKENNFNDVWKNYIS